MRNAAEIGLRTLAEGTPRLRPVGVRGVIEVCEVHEQMQSNDDAERAQGEATLAAIASQLAQSGEGARHLAKTLAIDAQVELLRALWDATFESTESNAEQAAPEVKGRV